MSELPKVFARAKEENRAALIGYFPAGFPTIEESKSIIAAMIAGGVDIVEVGLPYSDPIMDGPVIQRATEIALAGGFRTSALFEVVASSSAPTLVMSYWNPIEKFGVDSFAESLSKSNGVGVITPDLTIEESEKWKNVTDSRNLDRVFVVAPNTSEERLRLVAQNCSGFLYAASLMGVTGAREEISKGASELVRRIRAITELPVAVGLGISNGDQAREVASYADGVIVGSAFIKLVLESKNSEDALGKVRALAAELAGAVKRK